MVKNLPANTGDTGLIPGSGGACMPKYWSHVPESVPHGRRP